MICSYSKSLTFLELPKILPDKFRLLRENCSLNHEIKIFSRYLKCFGLSDKFPFQRNIICWGNLSLSKIITATSFYPAKLCRSLIGHQYLTKFCCEHLKIAVSSSISKTRLLPFTFLLKVIKRTWSLSIYHGNKRYLISFDFSETF